MKCDRRFLTHNHEPDALTQVVHKNVYIKRKYFVTHGSVKERFLTH